jgi:anaerobic C4-dicarboxylate transporter DcuB
MSVSFVLEALVVLGAIVMGTRAGGVAVGLWGGLGTFVLVFIFGEAPVSRRVRPWPSSWGSSPPPR